MSKMNIKVLDKNCLKIGILIFIIFLIKLIIPKFWWSFAYTGDYFSYTRHHFELKDIPRILTILGLILLIFASIFYFVKSVKEDEKVKSVAFVLSLVSSLLLIILDIYGLIYVQKIQEYIIDLVWLLVHFVLNLITLIVVIHHAHKINLIKIDKSRFSSKNEADAPFNLALIFGSIIFIISLIIIFIPSLWLPEHFIIRFPTRHSGDDGGYSFTFNLLEFIGFSYIIGIIALINSSICFIIYGIQKYNSLKKVGFGLGLCASIFFSTLNMFGLIQILIKINELPNEFLYWFGFLANLGFDVPPPPEQAFISAIFMTLCRLDRYQKNIILISPHLILAIITLILIVLTYKKTYYWEDNLGFPVRIN